MPNNIAVSITADVADLQVKRAILSAELKTAQKDLNDFAKTAAASGTTDTLKTSMLAAGDAVARTRNQITQIDREMKTLAASTMVAAEATAAETVATEASTAAHVSNRAAYEGLVLVHEAMSGRFSRMAGSAMILGQAMDKTGSIASAMGALMNPVVLVAGALTAAFAYLTYQEWEVQKASAATAEAFALSGRGLNESAMAVRAQVDALAGLPGVSRAAAQELLNFDASHAQVDARLAEAANQLIPLYAKAFGKDAPAALDKLKEALAELQAQPAEGAIAKFAELNRSMLNLTPAQATVVEGLFRQRDALAAVSQILQDLAARGGGNVDDLNTEIKKTEAELAQAKVALQGIEEAMRTAFAPGAAAAFGVEMHAAALKVDELEASLKRLNAEAAAPKGEDYSAAFQNSHQTLLSLRDSAERAHDAVKQLHDEMAIRRQQNPNDPEVVNYYANQAKVDRDLERRTDPGDFKQAKAPDIVSQWTEQLHQQEVASGEFFKDQTEAELKFWQDKLARTTAGSKDWLAVQDKIFAAQKTLAHAAYDDQLATLNQQLEADRDNWAKAQTDWNEKLAFIKAHYGEESAEYQNAYREFEQAEREHEQRMTQIRRQAAQEHLAEVQAAARTEQEIRARDAQTQEASIKAQAQGSGSPFAGVAAEQQIAEIQARAMQQQIEALNQEYATRSQILAQEVADAKQAYGAESEQYAKAVADKKKLDAEYFNQHRVLVDQAANQEIQAQQRIQQAWHSAIDPMVRSAGSAIQGLIEGTMSWRQALVSVGEAMLGVIIGAMEKVAEQMIVNAIMQRTTQAASTQAAIAANAAQAGSAGVASMAGAPFPLDLTAPEFGAAMAAAAGSFSLGGFAKGLDVVPQDMVAQIHAGERIVPAADNRAIISALNGGAAAGASGGSSGAGGGNPISVTIHAMDARSFQTFMDQNGDVLANTLRRQIRNMRF